MSGYCFFCGHHLGSAHITPPSTVTSKEAPRPSAPADSLSELAYVPPEDRQWYWLLLRMKGYPLTQIAARWSVSDEKVRRALKPLMEDPRGVALKKARRQFQQQRQGARKRGIAWEFSFEAWWALWRSSGKYGLRGIGAKKYVMARTADQGPYAPDNVRICTGAENINEAVAKLTPEDVRAIRAAADKGQVLAEKYGVSHPVISCIRTRKAWRWVE